MKNLLIGMLSLWVHVATAQETKPLMAQAVEQLKTGKFDEGIKILDQILAQTPSDYSALYNRAMAKSMLRRYEDALPDFNLALKVNPNSKKALVGKAIARKKLTDYEGAIADLTAALKLDASLGDALYNRALIYEMLGQADKACADYKTARKTGMLMADVKVEMCDNPLPNAPQPNYILKLTQTAPDTKYGYTKENPVRVGQNNNDLTANEMAYLDLLRDAQGKPLKYRQVGSCCEFQGKTGKAKVDIFEITYRTAQNQEKKTNLYLTIGNYDDPKIPAGLRTVR